MLASVIRENYKYLNFRCLMPSLIEKGLLDMKDCADVSLAEKRFKAILDLEDSRHYPQIASCLRQESDHLGHRYIVSLLDGGTVASLRSKDIIDESARLKTLIRKNFRSFAKSLSVKSLIPHLVEKELLTFDEANVLYKVTSQQEGVMNLFGALESKGPAVHYLFAQCLREEDTEPQHAELYRQIAPESDNAGGAPLESGGIQRVHSGLKTEDYIVCVPDGIKPLEPDSLLTGTTYNERRLRFEHYYHNGEWDKVIEEADVCSKSTHADVRVVGLLEMALSWIFRSDKDYPPVRCIEEAQLVCESIAGNNKMFLLGRCEYLLSLYFRYQNDHETARRHIEKAKSYLFDVAAGEDKSFAYYCHASLNAECLNDESSPDQFKEVEWLFEKARDNARFANLDILVVYSDLQLSRLYIGTTHTRLTFTSDRGRLSMARGCLLRIELQLDQLDLRRKSLFHLNMADWSYSNNSIDAAINHAQQARLMASRGGFPLEDSAAERRIRLFQPTETIASSSNKE